MRDRWTVAIVAAAATLAFGATAQPEDKPAGAGARPEDWIQLFNGKDLTGWIPKIKGYPVGENFGRTFRVEDGLLKVSYDAYDEFRDRFGHLFYEKPFSHYVLAVEYRFVGEQAKGGPTWALRNSGAMIHGQPPATMGKDQDFPISIEVQYLGGDGKTERPTASVCTPGTQVVMDGKLVTEHCITSTAKTIHGNAWVRVEAEVHGNGRIVHRVDGVPVIEYEKPQLDEKDADARKLIQGGDKLIREGYIALQAESHPIEFRKVELLNLVGCMDEKARNYRPYFEKNDPGACRYK